MTRRNTRSGAEVKVGMDMDGVVCRDLPHCLAVTLPRFPFWVQTVLVLAHHATAPLRLRPWLEVEIVTGRPLADARVTAWWMRRRHLGNRVHHNPGRPTEAEMVMHKANIIRTLGITLFVESDPKQAAAIAALCPSCEVTMS